LEIAGKVRTQASDREEKPKRMGFAKIGPLSGCEPKLANVFKNARRHTLGALAMKRGPSVYSSG